MTAPRDISRPRPGDIMEDSMPNPNIVATIEQPGSSAVAAIQPRQAITPMQMLQIAVEQGADLDKLTKLMDLQERWEANEARKAYVAAITAFKADPPVVKKNKHVSFPTRGDKDTEYDHATLDNVVAAIGPALAAHGLSHRWETSQAEGMIRVTCVLTHALGHSERVMLQSGADQSGGKNNIQAIGSAVSYLCRYTLLAACGLATADMDDDGTGDGRVEYVTQKQAMDLETFCESVGGDKAKFLRQFAADSFATIPAAQFGAAMNLLEKKKAAQK